MTDHPDAEELALARTAVQILADASPWNAWMRFVAEGDLVTLKRLADGLDPASEHRLGAEAAATFHGIVQRVIERLRQEPDKAAAAPLRAMADHLELRVKLKRWSRGEA